MRAHLEAGLERLAEPLLATGALDEKSFDNLSTTVEREAERAETVTALVDPYRRVVSDIENAVAGPTRARQDRGTRRAIAFIREHMGEALTLAQVARAAGFAPDYFSRLFKRNEGVPSSTSPRLCASSAPSRCSTTLRSASMECAQLCGFQTRNYFHKVFKDSVGLTPIEYRHRSP